MLTRYINFVNMEQRLSKSEEEAEAIAAGFCSATYGETPHGGRKTLCYFYDKSGNPCNESEAATLQILEFDANNICVFSIITEARPARNDDILKYRPE